MNELFGIPMTTITTALVALLAVCLLAVAWIGVRRPVIFKMGIRNIPRRKAQSALIVVGLMLSTLIITSALGTGDTVDNSMTSEVYEQLGQVDELVVDQRDADLEGNSLTQTIPADALGLVDETLAGNSDVDGIMPLLEVRLAAIHDQANLGEPDLVALGIDPARVEQFGGIRDTDGNEVLLGALPAGSIVLSELAAEELDAGEGDTVRLFWNNEPHEMTVAAVAENSYLSGVRRASESGLELAGAVMPLSQLQDLTGQPDTLSAVAISNTGGVRDSLGPTESVEAALEPALADSSLAVNPLKQSSVDLAAEFAQVFTGLFLVIGLFSIAAGILLILLIFTMLAAERRSEMGMARAVGTQRGQLIQQFISEGAAYALLAGLVGSALGVLAAVGMGYGLGIAFGDFASVEPSISMRSIIAAYCLGVVITFIAVVGSSWKVSRLNVVAAVRDLPDVSRPRATWRTLLWPVLMVVGGALMTLSGISSSSALPFMGGVSLLILATALILRLLGAPSRLVFTAAGLLSLVFWLLPEKQFTRIFGEYEGDFEMFFVSGLFLVISGTLVIVQNDRLFLRGIDRLGGLFRSKLPSIKLGIAYPGAARSRTGMTIAMFSLIVFSLVMIATMNLNFSNAFLSDAATAGWDVRGDTRSEQPIGDFTQTLEDNGVDTSEFTATGVLTSPTGLDADVRMPGQERWFNAPVRGMDGAFITGSDLAFSNRAEGYESDAAIIDALLNEPNVAIVDSFLVSGDDGPGADSDLLVIDDIDPDQETFAPVTVELAGPDGETAHPVTIIGVVDPTISSFFGIYANQQSLDPIYGQPAVTSYYVALADSDRAGDVAKEIESALLSYGVQGTSIIAELEEEQRINSTFFMILQGFMGLGMLVGIAAIGVIAFRNVVERRQQIGVLRALGYQRSQVSLSFLIEAAFIVGMGVLSGTTLGLVLARNLMTSGEIAEAGDIAFQVPWGTVSLVLGLAVAAALVMTWLPARQASRIAPAEALRYE